MTFIIYTEFFELPIYFLLLIIFCLIIFFGWVGYRYKKMRIRKFPDELKETTVKIIEGTTLGTLSLLLGFTFSVAMTKFEAQRRILVREATDIRTALLRCDMYPDSVRKSLRSDFKEYIEARIAYYNSAGEKDFTAAVQKASSISGRIWNKLIFESTKPENVVRTAQMIPALNNMIQVVTERDAERVSHVPPLVLWFLMILILIAAFLLGTDVTERRRTKLPIISYAIVMSLTLNLIIELNQPGTGLINFDAIQQKIIVLRELVQ